MSNQFNRTFITMMKTELPLVSVNKKGAQFLSSSTPAHQPEIVLQVTDEMVKDEEHKGTSGAFGQLKGLAKSEYEEFSEVGI